jgi:hypothetical protein
MNLLKYQENNLSFDFILNGLHLFSIGLPYVPKTGIVTDFGLHVPVSGKMFSGRHMFRLGRLE